MTDASAILASLDRFIERFTLHGELISGHRVATEGGSVATINPLTNQVTNHSYHSDHSKQDTCAGDDHGECDSPPSSAEDSDLCLARKVLSVDGYSGKSGKSLENQGLISDHRKTTSGKSGKSLSDQQVEGNLIGPGSHSGQNRVSPADTFQSGPAWWHDNYEERSRHLELGGQRSRAEAEALAWSELEWRWHKQYGQRVPPGICGGCREPIRAAATIPLIDGSYVHAGNGHDCLITYGRRWRGAATSALVAMGLTAPPEETP